MCVSEIIDALYIQIMLTKPHYIQQSSPPPQPSTYVLIHPIPSHPSHVKPHFQNLKYSFTKKECF